MIAVDTQLLVYAHRREFSLHENALETVMQLAEFGRPWAIPWPCVHEFIGVVTKPSLFKHPSSVQDAFLAIRRWMESETLHFLGEGENHLDVLETLSAKARVNGPKIHDARIAAICLSNGVDLLYSCDRDFSRFPRLKVKNPLI